MLSLLVQFLGNTVDNGYLEMFCSHMTYRKEIYTWAKDDCANAMILSHSSALFSGKAAHPKVW